MTYSEAGPGPLMVCSQDGCAVLDQVMHDAGHTYAQGRWNALAERITALEDNLTRELIETRADLTDADARAHAQTTRAAAAERVATAAARIYTTVYTSAQDSKEAFTEFRAALDQWVRIRDLQQVEVTEDEPATRTITCRCPVEGEQTQYCAVHDRAPAPQGPVLRGETDEMSGPKADRDR